MIGRDKFLKSLAPLGVMLRSNEPSLQEVIRKAEMKNPWFIEPFSRAALAAIADEFLDETKCRKWLAAYPVISTEPKRVALVMAGNIPLVGFHDLFCVLASGHTALIKLSDKDPELLPFIADAWIDILPELKSSIAYVDRLEEMDAVIATGSNNSLRYFEYYFKKYPHIFRQNRNGIAVLTGKECMATLQKLAKDIFMFFGLGCRNVSKLYLPAGYDFSAWNEAVASWTFLKDHNKYKNNLDYNYAIYLINQIPHIQLGHLILKEDEAIISRIGSLHYSIYDDLSQVMHELEQHRHEIQCVVSEQPVDGWEHIQPGESQRPALNQYADGVDTMSFLQNL